MSCSCEIGDRLSCLSVSCSLGSNGLGLTGKPMAILSLHRHGMRISCGHDLAAVCFECPRAVSSRHFCSWGLRRARTEVLAVTGGLHLEERLVHDLRSLPKIAVTVSLVI